MDEEIQLLQAIHENAEMGTLTTPHLLKRTEDEAMRQTLKRQSMGYRAVADRAEALLNRMGVKPEGPGEWQERMAAAMMHMKTLTDRSSSHLADMLIQGGTMGVVQMTRELHRCEAAAGSDAVDLGRKLLAMQEKNIEELKTFL